MLFACTLLVAVVTLGCSSSPLGDSKRYLDKLGRDMGANDWLETLDTQPDSPPVTPKMIVDDQEDLDETLDEALLNALSQIDIDAFLPHPLETYKIRVRDLKFSGADIRSLSVCPPREMELMELGGIHEVNSERFARGSMTNIYKAYGYGVDGLAVRTRSVVKVVTSKGDAEIVEALYRDMAALEILGDTGIAPEVFHPEYRNVEPACMSRMMVSSFVGERTLKHVKKNDNFRTNLSVMASIAVRGLEMLQTLHSKGIVHGDIHLENFVFYNDSPISRTLKMIDFGRSAPFLVKNDDAQWVHLPLPPTVFVSANSSYMWTASLLSVYELQSVLVVDGKRRVHTQSRRDDMFRFAEIFVVLMLDGYEEQLLEVEKDIESILRIKTSGNGMHFLDSTFREFFKRSANMQFDEEPQYDYWIRRFRKLVGEGFDTPYLD